MEDLLRILVQWLHVLSAVMWIGGGFYVVFVQLPALAGLAPAAWVLLAVLIAAASLEAFAGFCLGCSIFGFLQRRGMIPEDVCEACNNIPLRQL